VRRVLALFLALGLLVAMAGDAFATVGQGGSCPYGGTDLTITRFCMWEGENSGGDIVLFAANQNMANLNGYLVTPPKSCAGAPRLTVDWNDCIDSAKVWIRADQRVCWYTSASFGGFRTWVIGPKTNFRINFTAGMHDAITSWWIKANTTSC
jgi:hypothetical protein